MATRKRWLTLDNHIKSRGRSSLPVSPSAAHKLISACLWSITDINPEGGYFYIYTSGWHQVCVIFQAVQIIEWIERKMAFGTQMWSLIHGVDINGWQSREQTLGPSARLDDDPWNYTSQVTVILYIVQLIMTFSIYTKCHGLQTESFHFRFGNTSFRFRSANVTAVFCLWPQIITNQQHYLKKTSLQQAS